MFGRQNLMGTMAIPATGRAGCAQDMADAVNAIRVILRCFLMPPAGLVATNAGRRRQLAGMNQISYPAVAIDTFEFRVNRFGKTIRGEDE